MIVAGVALGLAAATGQSVSYLCMRLFVLNRRQAVPRLLVLGHLIMGVASAAALPFLWPERMPPWGAFAAPLVLATGCYLLGQAGLFFALRYTDASRTSPLLGLKIVILAGITVVALHKPLGPLQWLAAGMAVAAAFVLNASGRAIPAKALTAVLLACVAYSLSDLNIRWLVLTLEGGIGSGGGGAGGAAGDGPVAVGPQLVHATLLAVSLSYVLAGLAAAAALPWVGVSALREWKYALPFAGSWLTAMVFLFACFATIGVVFGNIVQSTRGLISIVLGARVAAAGKGIVEERISARLLARRVAAGAMMTGAIALFVLGQKP